MSSRPGPRRAVAILATVVALGAGALALGLGGMIGGGPARAAPAPRFVDESATAGVAITYDGPLELGVGGGVSAAGDLLLGPTRIAFSRHLVGRGHRQEPPILEAALGRDASFIGAADMARSAARRSRRIRGTSRTREPRSRRRRIRSFVED